MERIKDKIGLKEFVAILILTIGSKLTDNTPAIFYNSLGTAAWIGVLLIGVLAVIPIFLMINVQKESKEKDLFEVILFLLGRPIGYLTMVILLLIGSVAIVIDSSIYTDIIGTMYFPKTPTIVIYLLLMGVCAYGAKRGIEQIGSFAWTILFAVKISLFIAILLTIFQGNVHYIFPLFGTGKMEILKTSISNLSIYADFLFLGFVSPFIVNPKIYKKGIGISLLIITIEISTAMYSFLVLFDYEPVKMFNYPFHETIRYIHLGFINNIETLFFPFWLVVTIIRFSFYLYLNAIVFGKIFKINEFEYLIPSLAILFVFLGLIPETPTITLFLVRENFLKWVTSVFLLLPCLLWVLSKLKGPGINGKV